MSGHWLTLYSPRGQYLTSLGDFERLEVVLAENAIGGLVVQLPPNYPDDWLERDALIAYWRTPGDPSNGIPQLVGDTHWLLSRRRKLVRADGSWSVVIHAVHPNHLIGRRIIAYGEESAEAQKDMEADDAIKAFARENFTAATDTTRNWSADIFTVEADRSAGGTVHVNGAYRNVLSMAQEVVSQAVGEYGTHIGFECSIATPTGPAHLRTYTGQRGQDRTAQGFGGFGLVLSSENGGLSQAEVDEDYTDVASYVYAGGRGTGTDRTIADNPTFCADPALIAQSRYGRAEYFANATQLDSGTMLEGVAMRWRGRLRPRRRFVGTADVSSYADFGATYNWGDLVVGQFAAHDTSGAQITYSFPCRVDPVRIVVTVEEDVETGDRAHVEQLSIQLRSIDV